VLDLAQLAMGGVGGFDGWSDRARLQRRVQGGGLDPGACTSSDEQGERDPRPAHGLPPLRAAMASDSPDLRKCRLSKAGDMPRPRNGEAPDQLTKCANG